MLEITLNNLSSFSLMFSKISVRDKLISFCSKKFLTHQRRAANIFQFS